MLLTKLSAGVSEHECGSISGILAAVKAHTTTLDVLQEDHSVQLTSIEQKAVDTFQQKFTVFYLASYSSSLLEVLITPGMVRHPPAQTWNTTLNQNFGQNTTRGFVWSNFQKIC